MTEKNWDEEFKRIIEDGHLDNLGKEIKLSDLLDIASDASMLSDAISNFVAARLEGVIDVASFKTEIFDQMATIKSTCNDLADYLLDFFPEEYICDDCIEESGLDEDEN